MSSMTLKEFMTRGNEGMEKIGGVRLTPNYTAGGNLPMYTFYNGLTTNEDSEAIRKLISAQIGHASSLNALKENKDIDPDYYNEQIAEYYKPNNEFGNFIEGTLRQFIPGLIGDNADVAKQQLSEIGTTVGQEALVNNIIAQVDAAKNSSWFSWLFKMNPKMAEAFATQYAVQGVMDKLGLDKSRAKDFASGLKAYDMNQHIPGMALAFGLPFGIGALTGHPGWGALLGLLGAGGYGYYQYNKMQQALLNGANGAGAEKPKEVPTSTPDPVAETAPAEKTSEEPETSTKPLLGSPESDKNPTANTADGEKGAINPGIQSGEKRLNPPFAGPRGLPPAFNKKETVKKPEYLGPHKQVPSSFGKKVEVPVQSSTQTSPETTNAPSEHINKYVEVKPRRQQADQIPPLTQKEVIIPDK